MIFQLDTRGMYPQAIIPSLNNMMERIDVNDCIKVFADNEYVIMQVKKIAITRNYSIQYSGVENNYLVVIIGKTTSDVVFETTDSAFLDDEEEEAEEENEFIEEGYVVTIGSDYIGTGDKSIGKHLMKNFVYSLAKQEQLPEAIILMNEGVFLSTRDSDIIDNLKYLATNGTVVYTCKDSLEYYELTNELQVGMKTDMTNIVSIMKKATKLINM